MKFYIATITFISISFFACSQNIDTLRISFENEKEVQVIVIKPNYYNSTNPANKFIPFYIFGENFDLLTKRVNTLNTQEPFIYIKLDLDGLISGPEDPNIKYLEQNLFTYIQTNYKSHNFNFGLSSSSNFEEMNALMQNDLDFFDFYLLMYEKEFGPESIFISSLIEKLALNETQKSINIISNESSESVKEYSYFSLVKLNIYSKPYEDNIDKFLGAISSNYAKSICRINFNLLFDSFKSSPYYFEELKEKMESKSCLPSNRNLNQLAYDAAPYNGVFSIEIIDFAIQMFPEDLNLYHSKGQLYKQLNQKEKSIECFEELKRILESRRSQLDEKTISYWLDKCNSEIE